MLSSGTWFEIGATVNSVPTANSLANNHLIYWIILVYIYIYIYTHTQPEKAQQWETLCITTYNKNNRELFTEIIKSLEELKNHDKI